MFHVGVVENRYDPLKLGRCQVRVVGLHTDDRNQLPTRDLPWAYPIQPVTSAAISGIGHAPVGPVEGTWVIIIFQDKDQQMPLILGTLGGVPHSEGSDVTPENLLVGATDQLSFIENVQDSVIGALSKALGINAGTADAAKQSAATTTTTTTTTTSTTTVVTTSLSLGKTSEKYESGGKGPGTINDYNGKAGGDLGGASYGTYQFASFLPALMTSGKPRTKDPNPPVMQFIKSCRYSSLFDGLTPATAAFDAKWKEIAQKFPDDFALEQHEFVKKKYYDQACTKLKTIGFDHTKFGAGCQDMIWSTAVQYGPGKVVSIWQRSLNGVYTISETELITKIQDNKKTSVTTDFARSSASIQQGVASRCESEKAALLKLAGSSPAATTAQPIDGSTKDISKESASSFSTKDQNKAVMQQSAIGFRDPNKKYPLYEKEQDTSRLARNSNIKETIIQKRDDNRVQGVAGANNQPTWDEPESSYAAAYPFNHVYQSESGHVMEFDDTEGAERIHQYHKAGTYTEIDRNGRQVTRIVGDGYEIIDRNGFLYVAGNCSITVGGNCNIYAQSDLNIQADGDTVINSNNDVTWNVAGSMDLSVAESFRLHAKSISVESDSTTSIFSESALTFQGNSSVSAYAKGEIKLTTDSTLDMFALGATKLGTKATLDVYAKGATKLSSDASLDILSAQSTKLKASSLDLKSTSSVKMEASGAMTLGGSTLDLNPDGAVGAAEPTKAGTSYRIVPNKYNDTTGEQTNTEDRGENDPAGNFVPPKSKLGNSQSRSNPGYPNFPNLTTSSRSLQVDQAFELDGELTPEVKQKMIAQGYATEADFVKKPAEVQTDTTTGKGVSSAGIPVDSKTIDSMQEFPSSFRLSPNFTLADLTTKPVASPTKLRAVFNQTEQDLVKNLQGVALNVLEPLLKEFPTMQVTSAFRDYNTASKLSAHCQGCAVDLQFKVANSEYFNLAKKIRDLLPSYDQILLEYKSTGTKMPWIHIAYKANGGNRGETMTFFNHAKHSSGFTQLV